MTDINSKFYPHAYCTLKAFDWIHQTEGHSWYLSSVVSWTWVTITAFLEIYDTIWYDMMYLVTTIGLTPGGSSTEHIYTQTIRRTTQSTQTIRRTTQLTNWGECGPCPVFVSYTLAFALQLRKKHGKTSVRAAEEYHQLVRWKQKIQKRAYIVIRMHKHNNKNT